MSRENAQGSVQLDSQLNRYCGTHVSFAMDIEERSAQVLTEQKPTI